MMYNAHDGTEFLSEFYEGDQEIDIFPSPFGDKFLVRSHKFEDKTGISYYGQNTLSLMKVKKFINFSFQQKDQGTSPPTMGRFIQLPGSMMAKNLE